MSPLFARALPVAGLSVVVTGALLLAPGASATPSPKPAPKATASTKAPSSAPMVLKRTATSVSKLAGKPRALSDAGRMRVIIELDGATVTDKVEAEKAAGQKVTKATKARARAEVRASQAAPTARLTKAGAKVERHYVETVSGVSATVRRSDIAALEAVPGVLSVTPVSIFQPDNGRSNNYTGAAQAWAGAGVTGAGVKIAIIDSGIDYGHADFGGPGTTAYFDSNDTTVIEESHPFPTAKVVAGYDFVGDNYDASSDDPSKTVPVPDPDPMDCGGHGTHVAGTAAGFGVTSAGATYSGTYSQADVNAANLRINPGSAPQASLLAYRVFGCDGSVDSSVVLAAIDRAVADGAQVINMSLGSSYGTAEGPEEKAIGRAVKAGVTVVVSAGNSGWMPYLVSTPSTAPAALSVAALDAVAQFPGAVLTSGGTSINLINANDETLPGPAQLAVLSDGSGGIGLGCSAGDYAGTTGKIVVTKRGMCDRIDRVTLGQAAGAVAVIMVNTSSGLPPFEGPVEGVTIPFLGAEAADETALLGLDGATASLAVTDLDNPLFRAPASFTSSGPRSGDAGAKPDVAAPGVSLISAAVGTGNGPLTESGTSMAAPHTAGIAALVRAANPTWTGQQVKNAIANTASTDAAVLNPLLGDRPLIGNGVVQPLAALDAGIQLQATKQGDTGLSFGVREGNSIDARATITVVNAGAGEQTVTLSAVAPDGTGLSVTPSTVKLKKGSKRVDVRLRMAKASIAGLTPTYLPLKVGSITATAAGVSTVRMPVQVIVYARSDIEAKGAGKPARTISAIDLRNKGIATGRADVYEWLVKDKRDRKARADLRALGAMAYDAGDMSTVVGDRVVVMAVSTYSRLSNAAGFEYDIYLDRDSDGTPDALVVGADYGYLATGSPDGTLGTLAIDLITETGAIYQTLAPLNGSVAELPFLASDIGLSSGSPIAHIMAIDTYDLSEFPVEDFSMVKATFNAFSPQRSAGDSAVLTPGASGSVPVSSRAATAGERTSLGWMIVASNNRSGEDQSLLVGAKR